MQTEIKTLKSFLNKLRSENPAVCWEAAKQLTLIDRTLRKGRAVTRALRTGSHPHTRAAAAYVLGWWRERQAVPTLERIVDDTQEDALVREYAAEALSHNRRPQSIRLLLRHVNSTQPGVSYACIYALGQSKSKRALTVLSSLAKRENDVVYEGHSLRREAREAARNIRRRLKRRPR